MLSDRRQELIRLIPDEVRMADKIIGLLVAVIEAEELAPHIHEDVLNGLYNVQHSLKSLYKDAHFHTYQKDE